MTVPRHSNAAPGEAGCHSTSQPAIGLLASLQAVELALDGVGGEQLAQRPARARREVERAEVLALDPALHRQLAGRRDEAGEALELGARGRLGVDDGVEHAEREAQLVGTEAVGARRDLAQAEVGRAGEPGMRGDAGVVRGDGVGRRRPPRR